MVLRACRYFGHTRDYWWGNLTWSLYAEMGQQLAEEPPVDLLIGLYFQAQKWWSPPRRTPFVGSKAEDEAIWECPLPDVTE